MAGLDLNFIVPSLLEKLPDNPPVTLLVLEVVPPRAGRNDPVFCLNLAVDVPTGGILQGVVNDLPRHVEAGLLQAVYLVLANPPVPIQFEGFESD